MEPLDAVWEWYRYACDSIRLAARHVKTGRENIPPSFAFAFAPTDAALRVLTKTRAELDDLTVLALFAVFEEALLDDLVLAAQNVQDTTSTELEGSLASRAFEGLDRWPLDEILDVYKAAVDAEVVGLVKQVKDYRDWVAHGKKGTPDARIDPRMAYERLRKFFDAVG